MNRRIAIAAFAAFFIPAATSDAATRVEDLINRVDDLWRGKSSEGVFEMRVVTKNYTRTMRMQGYSLGKDYSLVRILAPKKEKGTTTLKSKNDIYTYLPKTDRTIRLTSGMMMGSWMGSHFTNDDLVKESRLLDDYDAKITFEGERGGEKIIEITLIPKEDAAVVWGKVVLVIEAEGLLPKSQTYYDEDLAVARTMTLSDVKEMGGRRIPTRMQMVPADKPNEKTEMIYKKIEFDIGLDEGFFSIAKLRRR
jgi:hypothetical protein